MKRHVVAAASVRLAASLAGLALMAVPALAGDRALIDFIGFSEDGQYFAFEEFGVQDGSGFPFSTIYVLDVAADKWADGSPVRVQLEEDGASLQKARAEAASEAEAIISELGIDAPVDLIALNADGELGDGSFISFGQPGYFPNNVQGAYTLTLDPFPADSPAQCEGLIGEKANGIILTLSGGEQPAYEIYRDKTVLPESRGCPSVYRIYAIVAPQYTVPPAAHVAIIATYPFGFEGPDRRFIAIPLSQ
jgi:predicted secreted protein